MHKIFGTADLIVLSILQRPLKYFYSKLKGRFKSLCFRTLLLVILASGCCELSPLGKADPLSRGQRSSPSISFRLALSVCGQRAEFSISGILQKPVMSATSSLNGKGRVKGQDEVPCGWIDWRLNPSHPNVYTSCDRMKSELSQLGDGQTKEGNTREGKGEGDNKDSRISMPRIVGGQEAKPGQFPFMASVGFTTYGIPVPEKYIHRCGASIINEYWVVTADHCIFEEMNSVLVGVFNWDIKEETQQLRNISKILNPPKPYNKTESPSYDISMIKVDRPFVFNEYVQPISLPPRNFEPQGMVTIAGWGFTQVTEDPKPQNSKTLHFTQIPVIPRDECQKQVDKIPNLGTRKVYPNTICIGFDDGHANACFGDSGGPMVTTIDGKDVLLGVADEVTIKNCSAPGRPSLYERVSYPTSLDYIAKSIAEN